MPFDAAETRKTKSAKPRIKRRKQKASCAARRRIRMKLKSKGLIK